MSSALTSTADELAEALSPSSSPAASPSVRRLDTPIGRVEVTCDGEAITSLAIERDGILPHDHLEETSSPLLERTVTQLTEYFAGTRRTFDVPVSTRGTAFQEAVWAQLRRLAWGETSSYGAIGLATGRPTAGRAVGGAIGANPVPILIGCHRVLASGRRITGYSGGNGIPTKTWLLDHESISHI